MGLPSLRKQLTSEPGMDFPKSNWQYALITDATTCTADTPRGLGAILTQVDKEGNLYTISFGLRQMKNHEKNCSLFLLEAATAVWGIDFFNEYLQGKQFILYTDYKPQTIESTYIQLLGRDKGPFKPIAKTTTNVSLMTISASIEDFQDNIMAL
jgi:hypothetical protein